MENEKRDGTQEQMEDGVNEGHRRRIWKYGVWKRYLN